MLKVNIISKVEVPVIKEATIAKLIKDAILAENPGIQIDSLTFERKLTPSRIEAIVEASVAPVTSNTPVEVVTETKEEEVQLDLTELSEEDEAALESAGDSEESVEDIFAESASS